MQCNCAPGHTGKFCEQVICNVSNPCLNNGVCIIDKNFTINYPEKDKDLVGLRCSCRPGYEGFRCENARYVVGCPPVNPCLHGGKCVERPFGFACNCIKDYVGHRCQYKGSIPTSTRSPSHILTNPNESIDDDRALFPSNRCNDKFACKNNGVCLETMNGFKCMCLPEFTGPICEQSKLFYVII